MPERKLDVKKFQSLVEKYNEEDKMNRYKKLPILLKEAGLTLTDEENKVLNDYAKALSAVSLHATTRAIKVTIDELMEGDVNSGIICCFLRSAFETPGEL
ncbi:MAG: hypothetical protein ABFD23_02320 [Caldisericales bacterium]|nr:hypothetical protein [Caldisericia bacterium]MBP6928793.1 hypothetical protein [Caldisericia bacterium]MCE5176784.1 hypothetical protein [bacterium]